MGASKYTDYTNKDWREAKSKVLKHLKDGWSVNVAFRKANARCGGKLYNMFYVTDLDFQKVVQKFHQNVWITRSSMDRIRNSAQDQANTEDPHGKKIT